MSRVSSSALRLALAAIFLFFGMGRMKAQEPAATPPKQEAQQEAGKQAPAKEEASDEDENPFAPVFRTKPVKRRVHANFAKPAKRRENQFVVAVGHSIALGAR